MKKIGVCMECGREMYTNDINLCKRCFKEVGTEFIKEQEPEELLEQPEISESLNLETAEEPTEEITDKE